jgi:hypothetical protein
MHTEIIQEKTLIMLKKNQQKLKFKILFLINI